MNRIIVTFTTDYSIDNSEVLTAIEKDPRSANNVVETAKQLASEKLSASIGCPVSKINNLFGCYEKK